VIEARAKQKNQSAIDAGFASGEAGVLNIEDVKLQARKRIAK
jgi:hypothetical protein